MLVKKLSIMVDMYGPPPGDSRNDQVCLGPVGGVRTTGR